MLSAYMNEIIAGGGVVLLIIIYLVIKKSNNTAKKEGVKTELKEIKVDNNVEIKKEEIKEDEVKKEEIKPQKPYVQEITEKAKYVKIDSLSGKEEGSFGVEDDGVEAIKEVKQVPKTLVRKKKVVPPHAKITKDDFKEFAGKRILVAEDNLINQKVISGLLADTGIELVMADDGQIALEILQQDSNFQFILMDAHMPRIDGFEATRQIRQNSAYNHIVVVALSGDTASDDIKKMSDAGMEEHLEKPLRMDALYDILYTYSDEQGVVENTTEEELELDFQEIDVEEGLFICGDDDEFYKEILTQFTDTYSDSAQKLEKMFQNANMQEASQYLLDISGIAANIGAKNISEIAKDLRESIKNPKDSKYLDLFRQYTKSLDTLLKEIKEI